LTTEYGVATREPLWADAPWRAALAISGLASVLALIIGPNESPRQLGSALGSGVGTFLWSALFLGWKPTTRRWLPTAVLCLAVLSSLAATLKRYTQQGAEPHSKRVAFEREQARQWVHSDSVLPENEPAQGAVPVDSNSRLTYRFEHPIMTPLELAKAGLPTFDGELLSIDLQRGDSVAQITGRVRAATWARNPEVWGYTPGGKPEVYFGPLHAYLAGEPHFHILVKPARCAGCEGIQEVIFLRYKETGYLVGRPLRQPR
jgi:hypothetical protein